MDYQYATLGVASINMNNNSLRELVSIQWIVFWSLSDQSYVWKEKRSMHFRRNYTIIDLEIC